MFMKQIMKLWNHETMEIMKLWNYGAPASHFETYWCSTCDWYVTKCEILSLLWNYETTVDSSGEYGRQHCRTSLGSQLTRMLFNSFFSVLQQALSSLVQGSAYRGHFRPRACYSNRTERKQESKDHRCLVLLVHAPQFFLTTDLWTTHVKGLRECICYQ